MTLPTLKPKPRTIADLLASQRKPPATAVAESTQSTFAPLGPDPLDTWENESPATVPPPPRPPRPSRALVLSSGTMTRSPEIGPREKPLPPSTESIEVVEGEVIEPEAPEPSVTHVHVHMPKSTSDDIAGLAALLRANHPATGFPRGSAAPRVIPGHSPEARSLIAAAVASADAAIADSNKLLSGPVPETKPAEEVLIDDENEKLDRLIDDDFPFDETQLAAVHGMVTHQFACMIGEAGTGKTTVTKKLVDLLKDGVEQVDLSGYWQRGEPDEHDDYVRPEHLIPSICMVSFTGRASQMVKKNFPRTWHPNIMTIHRMLGFYPIFEEDTNEKGEIVNRKRFIPSYNAFNKVPWKIIIIDEAGMLGLDLWHQLLAACPDDTRIYMIGDIRQLPPTHGKSILGFALGKWPTYALTHVHRQKGVNNSIVDNAHMMMNGRMPVCDSQVMAKERFPKGLSFMTPEDTQAALGFVVRNKDWRFLNIRIDENPHKAQMRIRQVMKLLFDKTDLYHPSRDIIITPTNGKEPTAPGYVLGQIPLNQGLVSLLNAGATRYWIDGGRERPNFAVGDKVMATVNDYEAGITNGMTGLIEEIRVNGDYQGNAMKFGPVDDVADYLESCESDEDLDDLDLDSMMQDARDVLENKKKPEREVGPASHTIVVRFGEGDHSFTVDFRSKSQVASLMLAYAATCHKMQGGEAPLVFVIVHSTQKRPLTREWVYTACTRASGRCVFLSTRQGMGIALSKSAVEGKTIQDKINNFIKAMEPNSIGAKINVRLPEARSLAGE